MLVGFCQSFVMLALASVFCVMDLWLLSRYRARRASIDNQDWVHPILTTVAAVAVVVQPVLWPGCGLHTEARWGMLVQGVGLVVSVAALVLHLWARLHLKQFHVRRAAGFPLGQYLVDSGPYAYVRHPIYASYIALVVGLLMISPGLMTLLVIVYLVVNLCIVVRREEKLLLEDVADYAAYRERTPAFLPTGRRQVRRE